MKCPHCGKELGSEQQRTAALSRWAATSARERSRKGREMAKARWKKTRAI
jgi:hypothetical protein